jgi:transcriptional regulator with XRE-family HTH domain
MLSARVLAVQTSCVIIARLFPSHFSKGLGIPNLLSPHFMIGPVVRQLRLERKLSQETLAANARVSSGYLSKLERGVYKAPSREVLTRIADALSIAPADLFRAAGLEHLLTSEDSMLGPLLETFANKLNSLPRRDRDIIVTELRRIFRIEEEQAG